MKTIFITGASAGLGKAAAKLFQSKGWRVIASMRSPEQEQELNQLENIVIVKLDVTSSDAISEVLADVIAKYEIDVLLNNAGYGLIGPLESLSEAQIERQVNTNLLGVIRLTKALVPYFREKRNGTFINVTSSFGLVGYPTCSLYSATKFAVDGFSESLAYELAQFGISVKTVAPGGIQTDFAGRSLDLAHHDAYSRLVAKVSEGCSAERISEFLLADDVAAVIYEAATDGKNQLRYIVGRDAKAFWEERFRDGSEAQFRRIRSGFEFGQDVQV